MTTKPVLLTLIFAVTFGTVLLGTSGVVGAASGVCGDGVLDESEACDDGFTDACGTCNADCTGGGDGYSCGDGIICPEFEVCDDAGDSETCDYDCTLVACGDAHVNFVAGEECDDGNTETGDGCSMDTEGVCSCEVIYPAGATLTGTNSSPYDANAVQCAANQGGIVTLQDTFDFGDTRVVVGTDNVTVRGSGLDANGEPLTKIRRGNSTFLVRANNTTIQNICFDGFRGAGILVAEADGVTVFEDNLFINGLGEIDYGFTWPEVTVGIEVMAFHGPVGGTMVVDQNTFDLYRDYNSGSSQNHPTGHLIAGFGIGGNATATGYDMYYDDLSIENNEVRMATPTLFFDDGVTWQHTDWVAAIALLRGDANACTVQGNTIDGSFIGVWTGYPAEIHNNEIRVDGTALILGGNGMRIVDNTIEKTVPVFPDGLWPVIRVVGNVGITMNGVSDSIIKNNHIDVDSNSVNSAWGFTSMGSAIGGIWWEFGDTNTIKNNEFSGTALFGIYLNHWQTGNIINNNDFSGLTAAGGQIYISSGASSIQVKENYLGPLNPEDLPADTDLAGVAGIICEGVDSQIKENSFVAEYPGWDGNVGYGWYLMTASSSGNKLRVDDDGDVFCHQILDMTVSSGSPFGANDLPMRYLRDCLGLH
jgi:cysteine-rich repeat protein/parallel beta-helix repeat protein